MSIESVVAILQRAKEHNMYGYIEVTIPGKLKTEYIVNHPDSLDYKIEYYKRTYDAKCVHKNCPDIRIVSAGSFIDAARSSSNERD